MLPVSTFVHMTDEEDFGRPFPNTSPLFNSPTADLVLSSSNSFHVRGLYFDILLFFVWWTRVGADF
jgi:hypothetical protein